MTFPAIYYAIRPLPDNVEQKIVLTKPRNEHISVEMVEPGFQLALVFRIEVLDLLMPVDSEPKVSCLTLWV
jgi:hypothetical protein